MKKELTIQREINAFLDAWDSRQMRYFLRDLAPLYELYDVDEDGDWLSDVVGPHEVRDIRLIRSVYLVSKIADNHGRDLERISMQFKNLWERMEKEGGECQEKPA